MIGERDYRYFCAVAKCLNFTEAAQNLYISQPALSKQIARMEETLGYPLFLRTKQDVKLTPGGVVLLGEYRRVSAAYEAMVEKGRLANEGKTGALHIGIQEGQSLDEHILSLVRKFRAQYEHIELEIDCLPYRRLLDQLQEGKIDVGLSLLFDARDLACVNYERIRIMPSYVMLSEEHPLAQGPTLDLQALSDETLLVVGSELVPQGAQFVLDQCRLCGFRPRNVRLVSSYSTLYLWLTMGAGFALMNQNIWYANKLIRFFPLPDKAQVSQIVTWGHNNQNPAVPLFVETI